MKSISMAILGSLWLAPTLPAQLDQNCTVSILNQTAQVQPDGTWRIDNIPAPSGPVRARANCVQNGVLRTGATAIFNVGPNAVTGLDPALQTSVPVPSRVQVSAPVTALTSPNQTVALKAVATFADGSTKDITKASTGTVYRISNTALAAISADGMVTAKASGMVLVQAVNEGAQGLAQLMIQLSGDSDGDGIPDDVEIREGLDPNNPADALADADGDGLTNLEEFRAGTDIHNPDTDGDGLTDGQEVKVFRTNPLMKDTDGDGVPDNVEVATGSDPNNPTSFNLAAALSGIRVVPNPFSIGTGGAATTAQLTVTGDFKLGGSINITARAKGTTYISSNTSICATGTVDGQVTGVANGSCSIAIANSGFTTTANGTVSTFTPQPLSKLQLPGFPNGTDAAGNFVYVAAGAAGLVIVDVTDPAQPRIAKTFSTPGNANGVRVVGNFAFVASGAAGLQVIDVGNPAAPVLAGSVDLRGEALDLNVAGDRAYVACGDSGFAIVSIADPLNLGLVAQVATPGRTRGVDVFRQNGNLFASAVADSRDSLSADDNSSVGLYVVDISDAANSFIVARLPTIFPQSVRMVGNKAYLAASGGGVPVVDLSNPSAPALIAVTSLAKASKDIKVAGKVMFVPDEFNVNTLYATDISDPAKPGKTTAIDFTSLLDSGDLQVSTSVAVSGALAYITTNSSFDQLTEKGSEAPVRATFLIVAQYAPRQDALGQAPQVTLTAPAANSSLVAGSFLTLGASATDDVAVGPVTFQVNGADVFTDVSEPFQALFKVPAGTTSLTVTAKAKDLGNNAATSAAVQVAVVSDPLTTISGRVVRADGSAVNGAAVTCFQTSTTSAAAGQFSISGFPVANANAACSATITEKGRALRGKTASFTLAAAGVTSVGDLTVRDFARVLLISDKLTQTTTSIVKELSEAGDEVTLRPPPQTSWDATNPALAGFDCVVHLTGVAKQPVFPVPVQQTLVSFVRAGGGYVGFAPGNNDDASTSPMHELTLYPGVTTIQGLNGPQNYVKVPGQEAHPVTAGLPATVSIFSRDLYQTGTTFFPFTEAPPFDVMTIGGASADHGVTVRQLGSGRVVRFATGENTQDPTLVPDPSLLLLIRNAAGWACGR